MTDSQPGSVGRRIAAARKTRGFRTPRDLAAALQGTTVTAAVIENLEAGRKANLDVSQLLSIAWALGVPPSCLLAPMDSPDARVDLPNLPAQLSRMSASEFDSWLCAIPGAAYQARRSGEREDVGRLNSLREIETLRRELGRLRTVQSVEADSGDADLTLHAATLTTRIDGAAATLLALEDSLRADGWDLSEPEEA